MINKAIEFSKAGNLEELKKLLDSGFDPNSHDETGWTPLLWASARGHSDLVSLLLNSGAKTSVSHNISKALPIHMAGHSGDVETSKILLDNSPDDLNSVWDLNGHTILLQAAFYGHLELADFLVKKGADTSITTARGLGPMEMAMQFQNEPLMNIIKPYDSSAEKKSQYYESYLKKIAPQIPPDEIQVQKLSDELVSIIDSSIKSALKTNSYPESTLKQIKNLIESQGCDVNRLGGALQQPPLIVTVTGNNGFPQVESASKLRLDISNYLLEQGANPSVHEKHPMGAQTIIRAAVFNHLEILKMCQKYMSQEELTDAINEIPIVNGLTALHDTVLRSTTAAEDKFEGYLAQCKWFMDNGGRSDIEDFSGRTQRDIADQCSNQTYRSRLLEIL